MERDELIVCVASVAATDLVDFAFPGSDASTREREAIHAHFTRVIKDTVDHILLELEDEAVAREYNERKAGA